MGQVDVWHLHNRVCGKQMSAIIIINFLFKKKITTEKLTYIMHDSLNFSTCIDSHPWRRKWQPTPVFLPGTIGLQRVGID